jgi:3-dehydroquinate dehydratase-1
MAPIIHFDKLPVGGPPMVVGAISSSQTFSRSDLARGLKLDIAEFRLDLTGFVPGWETRAHELRDAGIPVLLTLRSSREGGNWRAGETERAVAYANALPHASAIDVEIASEIIARVAHAAHDAGKPVVASFHDFARTPPADELRKIIDRGFSVGADIVKIAARCDVPADVEILESVLRERGERLLCVVGMGTHGPTSRVRLAIAGSCLTYGYADETNAPGQLSSAELLDRLKAAGVR